MWHSLAVWLSWLGLGVLLSGLNIKTDLAVWFVHFYGVVDDSVASKTFQGREKCFSEFILGTNIYCTADFLYLNNYSSVESSTCLFPALFVQWVRHCWRKYAAGGSWSFTLCCDHHSLRDASVILNCRIKLIADVTDMTLFIPVKHNLHKYVRLCLAMFCSLKYSYELVSATPGDTMFVILALDIECILWWLVPWAATFSALTFHVYWMRLIVQPLDYLCWILHLRILCEYVRERSITSCYVYCSICMKIAAWATGNWSV